MRLTLAVASQIFPVTRPPTPVQVAFTVAKRRGDVDGSWEVRGGKGVPRLRGSGVPLRRSGPRSRKGECLVLAGVPTH